MAWYQRASSGQRPASRGSSPGRTAGTWKLHLSRKGAHAQSASPKESPDKNAPSLLARSASTPSNACSNSEAGRKVLPQPLKRNAPREEGLAPEGITLLNIFMISRTSSLSLFASGSNAFCGNACSRYSRMRIESCTTSPSAVRMAGVWLVGTTLLYHEGFPACRLIKTSSKSKRFSIIASHTRSLYGHHPLRSRNSTSRFEGMSRAPASWSAMSSCLWLSEVCSFLESSSQVGSA
mmetsp:Transcript_62230/g.146719  ORF Transcript_62230/g.146719 Transcript_62230/m.146719 type:complete len:236 (-) Transcript_62230:209-916(-)